MEPQKSISLLLSEQSEVPSKDTSKGVYSSKFPINYIHAPFALEINLLGWLITEKVVPQKTVRETFAPMKKNLGRKTRINTELQLITLLIPNETRMATGSEKYCQQSCFDSENVYDRYNFCLTTHSSIKVPYKTPKNLLLERPNLTHSSVPRKIHHCTQVIPQAKIIHLHPVVFYQHFQEPKISIMPSIIPPREPQKFISFSDVQTTCTS